MSLHQNVPGTQALGAPAPDPLAKIRFEPSAVPGLKPEDWASITSPQRHPLPSVNDYAKLSTAEKIALENTAIHSYLDQKSPEYRAEIERIAQALPPMSPRCKLELVAPAYNEHATIGDTLKAVANASNVLNSLFSRDEWGLTVIVNRPVTNDPQREATDSENLKVTVNAIDGFQRANPDFRLSFLVLECPKEKANVGLARAVVHDVTAMRSALRPTETREAPMYIQTIDADTTHLNPQFFDIILGRLAADGYSMDFYRERDEFPADVITHYPMAHVIDFMWNDTISRLAFKTDQAWTVGRCMTVSLLAHCSAGGVYPFKFQGGVDEDIRIGTTIRLMRGMGNTSGQAEIDEPLLESDATRALMGITEVLQAHERGDLDHDGGKLTRDLHEAARLLKYYRNFHELDIVSSDQFRQPDASWLESKEKFEKAMPLLAIEAIANSFRQLAIDSLLQQNLRLVSQDARDIFAHFSEGRAPYSTMILQMTDWCGEVMDNPVHPQRRFVEGAIQLANREASLMTLGILKARGIEAYLDENEVVGLSDGTGPESRIPRPVRVTGVEGLRQSLIQKLST